MAQLNGMKEICNFVGRHEDTVLSLIRDEDLPAKKIKGQWVSDTEIIDRWRKRFISDQTKADDVDEIAVMMCENCPLNKNGAVKGADVLSIVKEEIIKEETGKVDKKKGLRERLAALFTGQKAA